MRVVVVAAGLALGGASCRAGGAGAAGPACDPARLPAAPHDVGPEVSVEDYARVTGPGRVTLRERTVPTPGAGGDPLAFRVEAVVRNAGLGPVVVERGGCEFPAVGYRAPRLRWPPAWAASSDCSLMLVTTRLGPGDSVVVAGGFTRETALGDSLAGGIYCTGGVVAVNGRKLVVPAGGVTF